MALASTLSPVSRPLAAITFKASWRVFSGPCAAKASLHNAIASPRLKQR